MDNTRLKLLPENIENTETPRVLIVDLSIRYGGASTRAIAIAESLLSWGSIIAGIEGSPVIRIAQEKGIQVRVIGKRRADPLIPFRLARVIRDDEIQVVDTQNIQSKFWVSMAALLVDVAFVSTLNSYYRQEYGDSWKSRFYHALDLFTNWKTDRFIAVSETIRKGLIEDGIPHESIDLIRNGVGSIPDLSNLDTSNVRGWLGIPQDTFLCAMVGRLVWAKGFDDFISAFTEVTNQIENIRAIIIGEGELRASLEMQIEKLGLQDRILLPGYFDRSTVLNILLTSDLYVMSSRSEGIPYALLEAAILGLPIVSTNCGGVPEIVVDGESALLVPVGDVSALSNAIVSLCRDRSLAKGLGENARKKIDLDYSLSTQIEKTKTAYLRVLQDRKKPDKDHSVSDR